METSKPTEDLLEVIEMKESESESYRIDVWITGKPAKILQSFSWEIWNCKTNKIIGNESEPLSDTINVKAWAGKNKSFDAH